MKKLIHLSILLSFMQLEALAQTFDADKAINSVVHIWVTDVNGSRKKEVLTGFVWKQPNQIITALHGMRPGWKIQAKYANSAAFREVRIKKVLPKADLVLLELVQNDQNLTKVVPIMNAYTEKITTKKDVYCIGLLSESLGIPTRSLTTGRLHPKETLEYLLPEKIQQELKASTSLSMDLDILFFGSGNLLPSNSGAPIFDEQGRLVGIGSGGLENGTINISWAIPAKYISELENSTLTQLPTNNSANRALFSSTVFSADEGSTEEEMFETSSHLRPIRNRDFEFYKTKTRSIVELTETSENPDNILQLNDEIIRQFRMQMDLDNIRLDVYEDIVNGIVVVVPEGLELEVVNLGTEEETMQVKFGGNDFTSLAYSVIKDESYELNDMTLEEVIQFLDVNYFTVLTQAFGISGFQLVDEYTYLDEDWEGDRKIINLSATGAELVTSPYDGRQYGISTYVTLLVKDENIILTAAVTALPSDLVINAAAYGINCMGQNQTHPECVRLLDFYKAFTAAHLTTFAY